MFDTILATMGAVETSFYGHGQPDRIIPDYSVAISSRGVDYPPHWERLEDLKKLGLVFTFCHGNAFRSRLAALTLRGLRVPTISAAFGDITRQISKEFPPDSVMRFVNRHIPSQHEFGWVPGRIRQATPLMAACARYMLVYCHESYLPVFIDPNDPRVHFMFANDPKDETEYYATYRAVVRQTVDFFHAHYPDRSVAMTCQDPITAELARRRVDKELEGLDFSCIPPDWGDPFVNFHCYGQEY